MHNDWRVYRPAIWLGMVGVALLLLVSPAYFGAALLGVAIGIGARTAGARRRSRRRGPGVTRSRRQR